MERSKMTKSSFIRIFFIVILISTSAAASIFMIIESAAFYSSFYKGTSAQLFGLFAAILNELFLIIMAAVWLPKVSFGKFSLLHPGNLFIKGLMLVLFLNTVGGATFNVVQTKFSELQLQNNQIDILKIREQQLLDTQKKLDIFIDQNQKVNTVIASRELAEVQNSLVKLRETTQSTGLLWLDIIMQFVLRLTIQLSNITSIWIASWLYRQPKNGITLFHGINSEIKSLITPTNAEDKDASISTAKDKDASLVAKMGDEEPIAERVKEQSKPRPSPNDSLAIENKDEAKAQATQSEQLQLAANKTKIIAREDNANHAPETAVAPLNAASKTPEPEYPKIASEPSTKTVAKKTEVASTEIDESSANERPIKSRVNEQKPAVSLVSEQRAEVDTGSLPSRYNEIDLTDQAQILVKRIEKFFDKYSGSPNDLCNNLGINYRELQKLMSQGHYKKMDLNRLSTVCKKLEMTYERQFGL